MMVKFMFEISNCIKVEIESDNKEDARMKIVENADVYAHRMVDGSCCISDGVEITEVE